MMKAHDCSAEKIGGYAEAQEWISILVWHNGLYIMKTKLPNPDTDLVVRVNALFPVAITNLRFVPVGESSWLYIGKQQNQPSLAIKIQRGVDATSSEVLTHLARHSFKWMPRVVLSKAGNLWESSEGLSYSVQEYVEPKLQFQADSVPDREYLQQLGKALHDLHSISHHDLLLNDKSHQKFHSPLLNNAKQALARLMSVGNSDKTILGVLAKLPEMLPEIEQSFVRLGQLENELSGQKHNFVLCHGDFHFGNTIQTKSGHLYIVDWDEAAIALPEFDLKYMSDKQILEISKGYGSDLPKNPTALMYYRNLLIARAVWFWVNKLIDADAADRPGVADAIYEIFSHNSPYMLRASRY